MKRKQFPQHCRGGAADVVLFHHLLGESCHHPRAGLISHAPEDLGAGLLLQWVEGGLHGKKKEILSEILSSLKEIYQKSYLIEAIRNLIYSSNLYSILSSRNLTESTEIY